MHQNFVDAVNKAFLDVMHASDNPDFADVGADDLRRQAEDFVEQTRLPAIDVPIVKLWQRSILKITRIPSAIDQLRDMNQIVTDKSPIHWRSTDSGLDVSEPDLDACLGQHPHALLGRALSQIAQSSFAPELWLEFPTYFKSTGSRDGIDAKRVFQVYVLYVYLNGSDSQAKSIASVLRICDQLRSLRAQIKAAKTLFRHQHAEIQSYLEALNAHAQADASGPRPNWQDFLKHRA